MISWYEWLALSPFLLAVAGFLHSRYAVLYRLDQFLKWPDVATLDRLMDTCRKSSCGDCCLVHHRHVKCPLSGGGSADFYAICGVSAAVHIRPRPAVKPTVADVAEMFLALAEVREEIRQRSALRFPASIWIFFSTITTWTRFKHVPRVWGIWRDV